MPPITLFCILLSFCPQVVIPHNSRHALGIGVAHETTVLVVSIDVRLLFLIGEL